MTLDEQLSARFKYQDIVEEIRRRGFPKAEKACKEAFLEMDNWVEVAFSEDERFAAGRVGQYLFRTASSLAAHYVAWRLYEKNVNAFLEFKALVQEEVRTGVLQALEAAQERSTTEQRERETQKSEAEELRGVRMFTRKEFYDLVWSMPATELAVDLGISNVMIAKICKKHGIPKPYLGYWAKFHAGQTPKQPQLSRHPDNDRKCISVKPPKKLTD